MSIPVTRSAGPVPSVARYLATALVVPSLGWLVLFGWDRDNSSGGPWSPWQVLIYLALLVVVGIWVAHGAVGMAVFVMPPTVTVRWSISTATLPVTETGVGDRGLWAVGALFLFVGMFLAAAVLEVIAAALRSGMRPRA